MVRIFIPNCRRASSRTLTRFSRRSRRSFDGGWRGWGTRRFHVRLREETPNTQHPTSNIQRNGELRLGSWCFANGCWALDVRCWMFGLQPSRRVTGAWWPSRSSKPLSVRFTGRGGFDSYPLRHVNLRISIYDLRFERPSRAVVSGGPRFNRRSSIVNPEKGGDGRVANADS